MDRVSNWDQYGKGMPQSLDQMRTPVYRPELAARYDGRVWMDPRVLYPRRQSREKLGTSAGFSLDPREPPPWFTDRRRRRLYSPAGALTELAASRGGGGSFMGSWHGAPIVHSSPSWYKCYDRCRSEGGSEHTCYLACGEDFNRVLR